jgi:hypothetical protein
MSAFWGSRLIKLNCKRLNSQSCEDISIHVLQSRRQKKAPVSLPGPLLLPAQTEIAFRLSEPVLIS